MRVEIVAHVVGKTGAHQHHGIGLADVKRVCRGGDCGSELHILLFGYQQFSEFKDERFAAHRIENDHCTGIGTAAGY